MPPLQVKHILVRGIPCTLWESTDEEGEPIYAMTRDRGGTPIPPQNNWAPTRCTACKVCREALELEELYAR